MVLKNAWETFPSQMDANVPGNDPPQAWSLRDQSECLDSHSDSWLVRDAVLDLTFIIRLCGSLSAPSCFPQWNPIAYLSTALSCKLSPSHTACQTNCTERLGRRHRAAQTNSLVHNLKTNNANTEQAKRTLTSQQWENVCVSILHRASAWNPGQHPDLKFIFESEYAGKWCLFIFWRG